jgi:multiple antibiotic resistance protein
MVTDPIGISVVVDAFVLLLIGVGPKIALVPFLELTAGMDDATKARVTRKMIVTACTIALLLVALGEFLARLLHFSQGALSIAGGVVLLIIAVSMILGSEDREADSVAGRDPLRVAVFPLAVPYLLNPVGIVVLVTLSGNADSLGLFALVVALLAVVVVLDVLVFRWANRVADHLDQSRMLVTEKVFGFLLAALAVQLVLDGLDLAGVIELTSH